MQSGPIADSAGRGCDIKGAHYVTRIDLSPGETHLMLIGVDVGRCRTDRKQPQVQTSLEGQSGKLQSFLDCENVGWGYHIRQWLFMLGDIKLNIAEKVSTKK
ncbi:uncharacterized protein NPIL_53681 [Nephila pilipes]|uniref:Uncharacterized protein n=1 Tax=Nephila pilipes TaxID=299642 RepID=A0A8X6TVA9_NEPPI|nr:uncharacterized protein NPIL_53681 [Nephila pilipes]